MHEEKNRLIKQVYLFNVIKEFKCYSPEELVEEFKINLDKKHSVSGDIEEVWGKIDFTKRKIMNKANLDVFAEIITSLMNYHDEDTSKLINIGAYQVGKLFRNQIIGKVVEEKDGFLNLSSFKGTSASKIDKKLRESGIDLAENEKQYNLKLQKIEETLKCHGIDLQTIKEILENTNVSIDKFYEILKKHGK